ncbi:beta-lactamase family protein [Glycomyces sp. A-F 0318]|uniref:serine hydrolase domain-containing protein n=1 Tax=Glycomyces amatae TaxID=2881355 RepID=UPI001E4977B0|nr:serine hydrolase domain-containing protein [Glycomyces amatae]MCD0445392.1 beta-lactamase family protein [Glycomyces amatae]
MRLPSHTTRRRRSAGLAASVAAVLAVAAACGQGADPAAVAPHVDAPAAAEPLTATDVDAWLDGLVPAALERTGIAGATVSVVHDGALVTARGYGYADTEAQTPVDPEATLFRAGSVSKLFTATAVMQLVERGEIDLDADIDAYLDFEIPREYPEEVTMRHLLTHTAGFEERIAGLIGTGDETPDLREALVNDPPEQVYRPGTTPAYSNYGNALAGYIVERVSGASFDEYVEANVLDPLGMDSSTFRQPLPEDLAGRVANGYDDASGPARPFEIVGTPPAGSLTTSSVDMARFMLAHLDALPEESRVLAPETTALMHAPALTGDGLGDFAAAPRMGLGFFDESRNGHRIVGHGGDTNQFHSHMQIYPEDGAGIFISLNSSGLGETDSLEVRATVLEGFADRYFPAEGEGPDALGDQEAAEAVAGSYVTSRGFHSTFLSALAVTGGTGVTALDDGRLLLEPDPGTGAPAVYEQVGPSLWQEVGGQRTIATRTVGGEVTAFVHDGAFTMLRAEPAQTAGLPVLLASTLVLLAGLAGWAVAAVVRRLRKRPRTRVPGRKWRVMTRVAMAAGVLAVGTWVVILMQVMGLQEVPVGAIRNAQLLQLVGALGTVPAAVRVVGEVRRRAGWRRVAGSALVLAALVGLAWFAVAFQLLSPDVSY